MMQVVLLLIVILYNALKMNMFLIIRVKLVPQALTMLREIWQVKETQYAIVSFVTITTVYQITIVYNAHRVHIMLQEMMPVAQIQLVILYSVLKMNMFPIIFVKHVQQEHIILVAMIQVVVTLCVIVSFVMITTVLKTIGA